MTTLIMQIKGEINFFNDIFNQIMKELGKGTIFFLFCYALVIDLAIIYDIKNTNVSGSRNNQGSNRINYLDFSNIKLLN